MRQLLPVLAVLASSAVVFADPALEARLDKGEVIVVPLDGDKPAARMTGVVDAAPAAVWKVIDDCARYKEFMPRTVVSERLADADGKVRCRIRIELPWPMKNLESVTRADHLVEENRFRRVWTLESGDYHANDGSWTLTPFKGDPKRTLVVYEVVTQPKSAMPKSMSGYAQRRGLPEVIEKLRKRVEDVSR
jgi:ribosome-associated toxin RatA of RatAB toxin-antitoxin module